MSSQPVIVTPGMMSRALADPGFYQQCPEFTPLKAMMQAMRASLLQPQGGCSGCRRKRVEHNLYGGFLQQLMTLQPEACQRFKDYFKIEQLMMNWRDSTGRVTAKVM